MKEDTVQADTVTVTVFKNGGAAVQAYWRGNTVFERGFVEPDEARACARDVFTADFPKPSFDDRAEIF